MTIPLVRINNSYILGLLNWLATIWQQKVMKPEKSL